MTALQKKPQMAEPSLAGLDLEHELHIEDCERLWRLAYDRFQMYGNPHDRDEALVHLHRMNQAILNRSPAMQAARHAEFERRIDEGVGFFCSAEALAMGRPAWGAV